MRKIVKFLSYMRRFSYLVLFAGIAGGAAAQPSATTGSLKDAEFVIEKEHRSQLPEVSRLFENAPVSPPVLETVSHLPLAMPPVIWPTFDTLPRGAKVLEIKGDVVGRSYHNNLQGGLGNAFSPFCLEVFLNPWHDGQHTLGIYLKGIRKKRHYQSTKSHHLFQIHGKLFKEPAWISGDLGYSNDSYMLNGVPSKGVPSLGWNSAMHLVTARGLLNHNRIPFQYQLDGIFSFLNLDHRVRENQWQILGNGDYSFHDTLALKLVTDLCLTGYSGRQTPYRNLVRCKPVLSLFVDDFEVQGGVNLVYHGDPGDTISSLNGYPVLGVQYAFQGGPRLYGGVTGDVQHNSLRGFFQENYGVDSDVQLLHTNQRFVLYGGLRGELAKSVSFHTGLSISAYQNLPCFVNSNRVSRLFEVRYAKKVTLLNGFGEAAYTNRAETLITRLRGDYYYYTAIKGLVKPWHRPRYQLVLFNSYRWYEKFVCNGSIHWLGGVSALDTMTGSSVVLKDVFDLSIGVDYWLNSRFSIFFDAQNLLASDKERYLHHRDGNFRYLMGLSYAW